MQSPIISRTQIGATENLNEAISGDRVSGMKEEHDSANLMRILGQFLMIPIGAFVYGVEVLLKTVQEFRQTTNQGLEVVVGIQPCTNDLPEARAAPASENSDDQPDSVLNRNLGIDETDNEKSDLTTTCEEKKMLDKDLHDDMLKLVRYKILFVKREFEHAFPEQEDLVPDDMDGSAFTAWKIAEFIQDLAKQRTREGQEEVNIRVPHKWKNYPPREFIVEGYLIGLPHDDKKFLRVYFEVLDRYPREKFRYEEQQIEVLKEIRDKLPVHEGGTPVGAAAGGAEGGHSETGKPGKPK